MSSTRRRTVVRLTYFRTTPGNTKYYTEDKFTHVGNPDMGSWCAAVRAMMDARTLPGLVEGHGPYRVLVQPRGREPHLLLAAVTA